MNDELPETKPWVKFTRRWSCGKVEEIIIVGDPSYFLPRQVDAPCDTCFALGREKHPE